MLAVMMFQFLGGLHFIDITDTCAQWLYSSVNYCKNCEFGMDEESGGGFRPPGGRHISKTDLIHQTELRVAHEKCLTHYLCPCKKCKGGHRYSVQAIKTHLRQNGRNAMLMHLMVVGDPANGYPEGGA
jgi:hypothetical protein